MAGFFVYGVRSPVATPVTCASFPGSCLGTRDERLRLSQWFTEREGLPATHRNELAALGSFEILAVYGLEPVQQAFPGRSLGTS